MHMAYILSTNLSGLDYRKFQAREIFLPFVAAVAAYASAAFGAAVVYCSRF